VSWTDTGATLLPTGQPAWAANGFRNWAPELHWVDDRAVAWYTSANGSDTLSIGVTAATIPGNAGILGPYADLGIPLVEHPDGVIDANFFEDDDGSRWLTYKIDGNAYGRPTPVFVRQLAPDGLSFEVGSVPVQILVNDPATWEGGVVEATWLIHRNGWYYLFYSGNVYDWRYRTGVARAASVLGPYEKRGEPILANNERWVGPGHGSVVAVGDQDYFVYHAWTNDGAGFELAGAGRQVLVDRIDWVDDWPVIHDGTPSRTPQPWPGAE
jgi:beta-xylosidase